LLSGICILSSHNVCHVSFYHFPANVALNDPDYSSVHSKKGRLGHENERYIELDVTILGFSYELSQNNQDYKALRYGRSSAASKNMEYTIKPGSTLQITKWRSRGDNEGFLFMVMKHDQAYTVHRRYANPAVTAIYSVLRLSTGYRLGMVLKPLQELLPSLSSDEVHAEVSEAFDIGLMMAEIDSTESWDEVQDSDFNDIVEIREPRPPSTLRGSLKNVMSCKRLSTVPIERHAN
jgi:hypothetical protein